MKSPAFSFANGTLTITQASQIISFPAITNKAYGDAAFTLNATSSSGLPVIYSVVSGPATINGNAVGITGAGTVTIAANQAGDANYLAAGQAAQSISFPAITGKTYGDAAFAPCSLPLPGINLKQASSSLPLSLKCVSVV
jgi:hypothetical protein